MTTPTSRHPTSPATRRRRPVAVAVIAAAMSLAACSSGDDEAGVTSASPATTEPAPTTSPAASPEPDSSGEAVAYEVSAIEYTDVTAPAGATIDVTNSSGAAHTFTAEDGSFDVAYAANEAATVEAPAEPGAYPFFCEVHPAMEATLTVE